MPLLLIFLLYAIAYSVALGRAGVHSGAPLPNSTPRRKPVRILIVGATGGTGRQLVAQALERGYIVTALVRNPSKLGLTHPQLTVVKGDILDPKSVGTAVAGQDAVLSALGHGKFFHPTRILSDGTRNIVNAMEKHGVPRLVCETSLGIGDSAGRMGLTYTFFVLPVILPFYFWDKTRQEQIVAQSSVDWVLVRPGALTNGAKRGRYRSGSGIGNYLFTVSISRADVADFMLNQLTSDTCLRTAVGVAG